MKRVITASRNLLDEFLKYHEDPRNYDTNPEGFDRMYEILDKYGTENETVDKIFPRATPEDQKKMVELIRPRYDDGPAVSAADLQRKFRSLQNKYDRDSASEYERGYFEALCDMMEAYNIELD